MFTLHDSAGLVVLANEYTFCSYFMGLIKSPVQTLESCGFIMVGSHRVNVLRTTSNLP